jgi:DNA polymerase
LQPQNLTRATIGALEDEAAAIEMIAERGAECFDDLKEKWGPVGRTLSRLIRPAFVAPEGYTMLWADWSAIEARVLPWLSGSEGGEEILDIFRQNDLDPALPDIYKQAAGRILGKPATEVTKAERQSHGKIPTLALGFGGGKGALFAMARAYGASFTEEEAQEIVDGWRGTNKWAVQFWDRVWQAVLWCMENPGQPREAGRMTYVYDADYMRGTLFAVLPGGRPLIYPSLRWQEVERKDKKTGEVSSRVSLTVRRARARLPLSFLDLVNNGVQGVAASLLRAVLVRLEDEPLLTTVLTTHDEVICLVRESDLEAAQAQLREIMLELPEWAAGLPVAAEVSENSWYSKCVD